MAAPPEMVGTGVVPRGAAAAAALPDGLLDGTEAFAEVAVTEEELALFTVR